MKTDGQTEVETAWSAPSPGRAPIKTWRPSSRRRAAGTPVDPTARFHGDGVRYKAKLIGTDEVLGALGDRMCVDSMMKLKDAALRSHGGHKRRIWLRVCSEGLKVVDEKTGRVMYEHEASRISSLRRDESDPRALAYVFRHLHHFTLFYIKMAGMADPVLEDIKEVFHDLDQVSPEQPTQNNPPLMLLDENDDIKAEALPSNELADLFTIQLDEKANLKAASTEPDLFSMAGGLSTYCAQSAGGSPFSSPTAMDPWGLAGPSAALSPPTSPHWAGGGGGIPPPWPSQQVAPAAWAPEAWAPAASLPGPLGSPMGVYGLSQPQQPPTWVTWEQYKGTDPRMAPDTTQVYSSTTSSGGPRAAAPQEQ